MEDIPAFGAPQEDLFKAYGERILPEPLHREVLMSLMPLLMVGAGDPIGLLCNKDACSAASVLLRTAPGALILVPPFTQYLFVAMACKVKAAAKSDTETQVYISDEKGFREFMETLLPVVAVGLMEIGFTKLGVWDRCEMIFEGLNVSKDDRPGLHRICFPKP